MERPRLKAHLTSIVTENGQVFLLTESTSRVVQGTAESAVVAHLDGRKTVPEIAAALSSSVSLPDVLIAIKKFEQLGLLADGWPALDAPQVAFWEALDIDPERAATRLAQQAVRVSSVGGVSVDGLVAVLRANGVFVARADDAADPDICLEVVVVDDYLNPDLEKINADFLANGQRWMLVKSVGYWAWMGPVMVPGSTGCWKCLEQRLDANRMVEQYLRKFSPRSTVPALSRVALPATIGAIERMATSAIAQIVATGVWGDGATSLAATAGAATLVAVDVRSLETSRHQLIKQPQCAACGDPSVMRSDPRVEFAFDPVAFSEEGGFRTQIPEVTFARLAKHVSPILGAVSWLEPLYGNDNGLCYSYSAGHNFAMVRNNMSVLRKNLRGNSGGKGRTDIQAKVSGICEAIERYSGVWSNDRPVVRSRADRLDGRVVLPNELMMFSDEQFENRLDWNSQAVNRLHILPERFAVDSKIDWTAAWSLTHSENVHVPSAYVWFGHPDSSDHFFTYSDGNGNASGNTIEEAILQGFLELVERDAVGIWWYNRLRRPAVDLESFNDPYIGSLNKFYASMARDLWMIDLTTDLKIPTFAALSHRLDHRSEDILLGFGAHVDPRLAALRALTEVNQFLPAVNRRDAAGNTVYMDEDPATLNWWRDVRLEDNLWLAADVSQPARADAGFVARTSVAAYVSDCVELVRSVGLEMLVVDQSRPDLELNVAKVMVPGLRHFWRRLAPGRLFDLPVEMGWLVTPTKAGDLNPQSVFF